MMFKKMSVYACSSQVLVATTKNELCSNQTLADDHDDPWPEDTSC